MAHSRHREAVFQFQRPCGARVASRRCRDGEPRGSHLGRPFLNRTLSLWIWDSAADLGYISAMSSLLRGIYALEHLIMECAPLDSMRRRIFYGILDWERVDLMWLARFQSAPLSCFLRGSSEIVAEVVEFRSDVGAEVVAWVVFVWCQDVWDFDDWLWCLLHFFHHVGGTFLWGLWGLLCPLSGEYY